ncbi:D-ribose ABC transporter substrate-binding protein [Latilactobacillus graminis]|uniref:ABC-type sugar transport system, periplasmic component n=2 Tax=Latilactobacillus graminis TaxID=60519 RepID=A0AA89KXQ3_9LACO|nr:D-ribose ABC transporter substrate-binding protein [Latilactobacillus graminis]KRM23620.1 ABC-type sugar transport system, periplasmic component [Latilactobacillus graminis DSM 20719]QFP80187.1 D-ribose ABC transporter substrate-binding protein [Latilactobacillus graminis]
MQKKFKVLVGIMAVTLLSAALAGCGGASLGGNDGGSEKTTKKTADKVKIGASISTLNNPFFVSVKKGINDAAKKKSNVQIFDAQNDTAKQSNDIEDMIQKKVDVLIINPVDSSAISSSVKDANDAGIPVITVDRSSDSGKVLTLVSSNSTKGGQMAAKYMLEKLGNGAKIAELQGVPGASATRERGKGFENAVKGKLDITAKQTASFDRAKGLTVTENILQGNPEIKGLFSQNDEMALGAAQAAKSANKDLMIVGFDGETDGLKAVKNGEMAATVAQQPEEMGRLAVKAAYDHFNGKKVKVKIDSPLELVTTDSLKK